MTKHQIRRSRRVREYEYIIEKKKYRAIAKRILIIIGRCVQPVQKRNDRLDEIRTACRFYNSRVEVGSNWFFFSHSVTDLRRTVRNRLNGGERTCGTRIGDLEKLSFSMYFRGPLRNRP